MDIAMAMDPVFSQKSCAAFFDVGPLTSGLYVSAFALLILLIQSWKQRRKTKCLRCFYGRFALPPSVNFLDDHSNKAMIVTTFNFSAMTIILTLFAPNYGEMGFMKDVPPFLKVFVRLFTATLLCVMFLPILACIQCADVFSCILGIAYVAFYVMINVMRVLPLCSDKINSTVDLCYVILFLIFHIVPGIILVLQFLLKIYRKLYKRANKFELVRDKLHCQQEYVRKLLTSKRKIKNSFDERPKKLLCIWKLKCLYETVPGVFYSLTILCSLSVGIMVIIVISLNALAFETDTYIKMNDFLDSITYGPDQYIPNIILYVSKGILGDKVDDIKEADMENITIALILKDQLNVVFGTLIFAKILAFLFAIITAYHMLESYRKNVFSNGTNPNFDPSSISPTVLTVSAIQFGGRQVAYMIIGYILQVNFITLLTLFLSELLILPLKYAFWDMFKFLFNYFGSLFLFAFFVFFVQYSMVRYLFLQNNGEVLGIDNRKGFFLLMYFMFFYNMVLTFLTSARLIKAIIFGIWNFPRLDRSIFPRNFEKMDSELKSYQSLLHLEKVHNHAVVCTFIHILAPIKDETSRDINICLNSPSHTVNSEYSCAVRKRKRARNLWFLAWTLIHNKSMKNERKTETDTP